MSERYGGERGGDRASGGSTGGVRGGGLRVRLPLLDRLLDADPGAPNDPPLTPAFALETLRTAVRRDLESLLNARRRRWPLPVTTPELPHSPLGYGIPDATSGAYALEERRHALAQEVERVIRRFEPRLLSVRVTLKESGSELDRTLRLKVDAVLRTDPIPEPISFETVVEAVSHEVRVAERT
ncbi:type VI secretion system baseplate subunit TssE [Humitalea sp. 24SJ18S-53]|uniref:type VI secretion system baseplate subunit TssE n=1 Tax=Humitalea sp. 24SJ18S-53 TaxID=3422307 RepID=UPI003D665C02